MVEGGSPTSRVSSRPVNWTGAGAARARERSGDIPRTGAREPTITGRRDLAKSSRRVMMLRAGRADGRAGQPAAAVAQTCVGRLVHPYSRSIRGVRGARGRERAGPTRSHPEPGRDPAQRRRVLWGDPTGGEAAADAPQPRKREPRRLVVAANRGVEQHLIGLMTPNGWGPRFSLSAKAGAERPRLCCCPLDVTNRRAIMTAGKEARRRSTGVGFGVRDRSRLSKALRWLRPSRSVVVPTLRGGHRMLRSALVPFVWRSDIASMPMPLATGVAHAGQVSGTLRRLAARRGYSVQVPWRVGACFPGGGTSRGGLPNARSV